MPPRVQYALTDKGAALVPLIDDMRNYRRRWLFDGKPSAEERAKARAAVARLTRRRAASLQPRLQ